MPQPTIIPRLRATADKGHNETIRAAAEKIAAGAAAAGIRDTLRHAGVFIEAETVTKLQASIGAGTLTIKEADKLLAGQSVDHRFRAKTALSRAGLLK